MTRFLPALVTLLVVSAGSGPAQVQDRRATGGAALAGLGGRFEARVVNVLDDDTFEVVTTYRRRVRIRLEGIDCPERGEPFSNVARSFTRQLAFDKTVQVEVRDVDRYGRLVARVTSEGKDLSQALIAVGLATDYTVFRFDPMLDEAERRARAERRGMWAQGLPRAPTAERGPSPSTPRAVVASDLAGPFYGNVRSRVYHAPTCRNARCKNCTREFRTQEEAQAAGFRAAGDCLRENETGHRLPGPRADGIWLLSRFRPTRGQPEPGSTIRIGIDCDTRRHPS